MSRDPLVSGVFRDRSRGTELLLYDTEAIPADWFSEVRKVLPLSRLQKADRIRREGDKKASLLAGWLLREALLSRGFSEADLTVNADGKPLLRKETGNFWFSLSHKGDAVGILTSDQLPAGLDIEELRRPGEDGGRKPNLDGIAARFFSEEEKRLLSRLSGDRKAEAVYTLWTAKEAYGKLLGGGLKEGLTLSAEKLLLGEAGETELSTEKGEFFFRTRLCPVGEREYIVTIALQDFGKDRRGCSHF